MTPEAVVVDRDVLHVRAEDESGAFGVLEHHADLLTALTVSVLVYRDLEKQEHFVAVRGGILTVTSGERVELVTREAVPGDDLVVLERDVLSRFRRKEAEELRARTNAGRLQGALLRCVSDYLNVGRERFGRSFP